jgi:hypothetical protein
MAPTPNLDLLKLEIAGLLASGVPASRVEDVYVGKSERNAQLFLRALHEFARTPRVAAEGGVTFRSGAGSFGRRSVAGFKQYIGGA